MSWLKIDDGFVENPKLFDLSDRAFRLHMAGLCFCARNLTDGILVVRAVKAVCALTCASRKHLVELRDAVLWEPLEDGYRIANYLEYNPDRETAKTLKEKRAEAGRLGGVRSGESRREATKHLLPPGGRSISSSPGVEPRPVPSRKTSAVTGDERTAPVFELGKHILKDMEAA